jgi:hypothetical protein
MAYYFNMNRISIEDRARIVSCLVEGNSIRSTVRITGFAKNTVTKLLVDIGRACTVYQDKVMRHLGSIPDQLNLSTVKLTHPDMLMRNVEICE